MLGNDRYISLTHGYNIQVITNLDKCHESPLDSDIKNDLWGEMLQGRLANDMHLWFSRSFPLFHHPHFSLQPVGGSTGDGR